MSDGEVTLLVRESVATVTLTRPDKLNAVTTEMTRQLSEQVHRINTDTEIRCVVLTGAGDRSFCVGSDLGELNGYDGPWAFRHRQDYVDTVRRIRKPVLAAVNGYAFGGGLELALACDIRLAARNATFAAAEIKLGWIGGSGQAYGLLHTVGPGNAARMLLTGDPVDAATAERWGLVSEVLDADELPAATASLAGTIARRPPIAAEVAKLNLRTAATQSAEQAIGYERDLQAFCLTTRDASEGRAAFAERREPRFEGR